MIIRRAVFRLTVRYSLIMLGAIALFAIGVAVYVAFAFEVQLPEASASEEAIDRANTALRVGLIACFVVLALLVPPLSYLLARSTLAPVRENLEAQQRFVDDASHELRTPLAVAQGELELSLMQPRTPEQYRETIEDALEALAELGTLCQVSSLVEGSFIGFRVERVGDSPPSKRLRALPVGRGRVRRGGGVRCTRPPIRRSRSRRR